jgi:hydroxymethylpyrimidine pyrophosphatase-like HAD family hydrolase
MPSFQKEVTKRKILIISYTFPPSSGIGGRRWAKFAKYLFRDGYDVQVITSEQSNISIGLWNKDIEELIKDNRISYITSNFPSVLKSYPSTIFDKIKYRLSLGLLKSKIKGNYYDRSSYWKKSLLKEINKLIKQGYITIIATGAPFHYLHDISELKRLFPELKLFFDFRDPWVLGNNYGIEGLNSKRFEEEKNIEKETIYKADNIFVPVQAMLNTLFESYPNQMRKFKILPHGFDPDDIPKNQIKNISNKIKFIYGGSIYDDFDNVYQKLDLSFKKFSIEQVKIDIFTQSISKADKYFSKGNLSRISKVHPAIPTDELFKKILESDYFLLIFPPKFKDFLSTKFSEIIALRIPIIYIGMDGFVSKFLVKNNLGIHISPNKLETGIEELVLGRTQFFFNKEYNTDDFAIPKILDQYFSKIVNEE